MNVGTVQTPNAGAVAIGADGIEREISFDSQVGWGDVIENRSNTPLEIKLPALEAGQGANLLVLQPGASARLEELGNNAMTDEPNRTKVIAQSDGVELFDISDDINTAVLEEGESAAALAGMVGAGSGLLGAGGLALAALGVAGAAALLDDDDDEGLTTADNQSDGTGGIDDGISPIDTIAGVIGGDGSGDGSGTGGDGTNGGSGDGSGGIIGEGDTPIPGNEGDTTSSAGLAGGVQNLSNGISQTPLEPVSAVTDALADGLLTLGDGIGGVSEDDPTGLTNILSEVVGNSETEGSNSDGLVGVVNDLGTGLTEATADTPLAPLVEPLSGTLGSDSGAVSGVADGLAAVGTTLGLDNTFLEPVTNDILSPVIGDNDGQQSGLSNTLDQAADGLDILTEEGSALEPLSPLTDGVGEVVGALSGGLDQVGDAIFEAGSQDPTGSGLLQTVGDLIGGDATGTEPASLSSSAANSPDAGLGDFLSFIG